MEYLFDHPPAHIILAGVYRSKQYRPSRKRPSQLDDLRREVMQIGGGFINGPLPAIYRDK
jgi:hypothetical protein